MQLNECIKKNARNGRDLSRSIQGRQTFFLFILTGFFLSLHINILYAVQTLAKLVNVGEKFELIMTGGDNSYSQLAKFRTKKRKIFVSRSNAHVKDE